MKSISSINREFNQKIEGTTPDELGEYLHAAEMSICKQVGSGAWSEVEGDIELEKLRQEVKAAADNLSIYQYLNFREKYHHQATNALGLSYLGDMLKQYDTIEALLQMLLLKSQNLQEDESRSGQWRELISHYQQQREGITSCKFWKENHQQDEVEAQS